MTQITEIMPDDLPEIVIEAIAEGQLAKLAGELQSQLTEAKGEIERGWCIGCYGREGECHCAELGIDVPELATPAEIIEHLRQADNQLTAKDAEIERLKDGQDQIIHIDEDGKVHYLAQTDEANKRLHPLYVHGLENQLTTEREAREKVETGIRKVLEYNHRMLPPNAEMALSSLLSGSSDMGKQEQAGNERAKVEKEYKRGFQAGIREYAWWKDGEEFVGSCGTTLKQALTDTEEGK